MRYQTIPRKTRPSSQHFQSLLLLLYLSLVLVPIVLAGFADPPRDEPDALLTLEKELTAEHMRHQAQRLEWAMKVPKPVPWATHEHSLMGLFKNLRRARDTTEPEILAKINEFRRTGLMYGPKFDPGMYAPLGTRWNFQLLGPYPSSRLVRAGFQEDKGIVETELDNALDALKRQNWMETFSNKFELAYTDNIDLLRSAIEYHERRLANPLRLRTMQGRLKRIYTGPGIREIVRPA
ncbi:uncharacterized protein UTRI_02605 [Ustilago trichophora]|uniref:Uncharacterized protein n=1 Tax=Ustilago trichophora TaxID=86804 RepID=A0A5C3END5_9BASI|nr:uncharacterized protein UTRI_02605 [Ustilago trichophora]